jgi:hypothetical protein
VIAESQTRSVPGWVQKNIGAFCHFVLRKSETMSLAAQFVSRLMRVARRMALRRVAAVMATTLAFSMSLIDRSRRRTQPSGRGPRGRRLA